MTTYDLIVLGEGYAGLTCAGEAARLGLKVATFEAEFFGGLVLNVNELSHFEEAGDASGMDHAARLAKENARAGVKSTQAAATAVRRSNGGFEVDTDDGTVAARAVVIATGARLTKLGVPGEESFYGRGVSYCADCDAPIYTDAEVVVAGGNDWAIHEALVLAQDAAVVHLVHEGAQPTASADAIEQIGAAQRIRLVSGATISEIVGDDRGVTGVCLSSSDGSRRELACSGVFPFIGLTPNGEMAPAEVERDATGHLQVNDELQTAVPGLWAIGNVRVGFGGWLRDAVADGRRVAQAAKAHIG